MTHSNIFSPNNHIRHSHYLAPDNLAPPSSFGRSGGFKSSLRKIPSALFNNTNKEKTPVKKRPSKAKLHIFADSPPRPMTMKFETNDNTEPASVVSTGITFLTTEKDKNRTKKPRKALADLFGWGNHHHSQPQPPASPQPVKPILAPAVPPKDHPAMLKKIGRPPSTKSTSSHFSSLRPAVEPAMAARSSMSDDPFGRQGEGAEVVDHAFKRVADSPSVRSIALDRRASIGSSKALSTKTVASDAFSIKQSTIIENEVLPINTNLGQRHVSAPVPTHTPLADLPPRSASLGKLLGHSMLSPPLPEVPESPIEVEEEAKTLKRDKTKSRVWGLLGRNKSRKNKSPVEIETPVTLLKDSWAHPPMPARPLASLAAQIDDKVAAATIKSNASSTRTKGNRPRPPVLHITSPSMDDPALIAPFTASTMSFSRTAERSTFDDIESTPQTTPSKYPMNSGRGGVWESVVGSASERPSEDGHRQAIEALMGPARLPKRKSLSGLFGLPVRKSTDKIKPSSPLRASTIVVQHRFDASPPRLATEPTLQSLVEVVEEASERIIPAIIPSDRFSSRFADPEEPKETEQPVRHDPGLRRVASATDKLFNLVTCLDFSPASSRSPTLHKMGSHNSLRQGFNGSPTPVRRAKSAMLSNKASGSSLKPPSANFSPLKLALHRAQAAALHHKSENKPASPPRESLVRKGMRNIFAPPSPSPVPQRHGRPSSAATDCIPSKIADHATGMGQTTGPAVVEQRALSIKGSLASDVPADLQAIISSIDAYKPAIASGERSSLGLPAPPPQDRVAPRRPAQAPIAQAPLAHAPPVLSLPPSPIVHIPIPSANPSLSIDNECTEEHDLDSVSGDLLTASKNDFRNSFDFTNEYAALDQGTQRASFVEALKKVSSVQFSLDTGVPPVPSIEALPSPNESVPESIPSFHISKPSDSTTVEDDSETEDEGYEDEETFEDTAVIHHVVGFAKTSPVRREPFKGQVAFQQNIFTAKRQKSHASFGAPEPAIEVNGTSPPVEHQRRRGHRRGESGLSIATMSSIGSVIGSGNERDYTNYFEVNFTNQNAHSRHQSVAETIDEMSDEQSPQHSRFHGSISSMNSANQAVRPTTRRGHHRRNSSIVSVESLSDIRGHNFSAGPPVSLHNNRQSGYISRHRRNGSIESTFGRPDWAAHRRDSSAASTNSNYSVSQIARPGLGDRMFQLDGGVQLTSITGSPPDEPAASGRPANHQRNISWDSLFDASDNKFNDSLFDASRSQVNDSLFDDSRSRQVPGSLFDSDTSLNRSSTDCDSLFGPEPHVPGRSFLLRGLRPVSTVSSATEASRDDTFNHVQRFMEQAQTPIRSVEKEIEMCLQGDGEDLSKMTPLGKTKNKSTIGRQMLGSSISRPQKPGRRRPAQLIISEPPLDTPGLTSPSASEASSRMSLDTNAASFTLGARTRPRGAGHYRQKSSAGVKVDATIHEMPSMATLRAQKSSASPAARSNGVVSREPTIVGVDGLDEDDEIDRMRSVRTWVEWEREAVDEFRKIKNCWRDSDESKHILEGWQMPTTTVEIAAFLAQSTQAYKPLDQLPIGRIAHRRKSSLSESRALRSPYGLPLPRPEPVNKPKMSLTTKYEKKNSTSSNTSSAASTFAFAFPDDVPEAPPGPPLSAIFAHFARETPPSPPPTLAPFKPVSPFHLPASDAFGLRKQLEDNTASKQGAKDEDKSKRSRVTSSARRQALGWGRRRNSDGPEKTIGNIHGHSHVLSFQHDPMPNRLDTALPLQPKTATVLATKDKANDKPAGTGVGKGKTKMQVFMDTESNARSTAHTLSGQENVTARAAHTTTGKARSPVKKRGLRQTVSQPRTLRV